MGFNGAIIWLLLVLSGVTWWYSVGYSESSKVPLVTSLVPAKMSCKTRLIWNHPQPLHVVPYAGVAQNSGSECSRDRKQKPQASQGLMHLLLTRAPGPDRGNLEAPSLRAVSHLSLSSLFIHRAASGDGRRKQEHQSPPLPCLKEKVLRSASSLVWGGVPAPVHPSAWPAAGDGQVTGRCWAERSALCLPHAPCPRQQSRPARHAPCLGPCPACPGCWWPHS